ncbi:MAG: methyltransferase [Longimicrobiales bacterium]
MAKQHDDPASALLARAVTVETGDVVVHMNCGPADFGLAAAAVGLASRVILCDRTVVAVEAARAAIAGMAPPVAQVDVVLGHGLAGLPADVARGSVDIVGIRIPREKIALLQLLSDAFHALRTGGRCCIAGPNNEGIKSAARLLEELFGNADVVERGSGCKVVVARRKTDVPEGAPVNASSFDTPFLDHNTFHSFEVTLRARTFTQLTRPGVFSWDHLDEATGILADMMRIEAGESVLDLGCGAGTLGVVAAFLSGNGRVVLVDADVEAVRCAQRTTAAAGLENTTALVSDVGAAVLDQRFDVVITNPPFHAGKTTELSLPMRFIHDAWRVLSPGGRAYLVANRTLPYETAIRRKFGNMSVVHDGARFKVISATKGG